MRYNEQMPDALFYRLGGGDLDRLFEQAYEKWTTVPLSTLGVPGAVLADKAARISLRNKLLSAAQRRRYSLRTHFAMVGDTCTRMEIQTAHSKYNPQAPRHIDPR